MCLASALGVALTRVTRRRPLEPRLDLAVQLQRQRPAVAVDLLAKRDADPAGGAVVFLDVLALDTLETDADAALQRGLVEIGARRIGRQAIGGVSVMSARLTASSPARYEKAART